MSDQMRSYWDLTEAEQAERRALIDKPLTLGAVQEAFRHPAGYGELRISATALALFEKLHHAQIEIDKLNERRDVQQFGRLLVERDELRAEVERLRAASVFTDDWPDIVHGDNCVCCARHAKDAEPRDGGE